MRVGLFQRGDRGFTSTQRGVKRGCVEELPKREREEGALIQERVGKSTKRRNKRGKTRIQFSFLRVFP